MPLLCGHTPCTTSKRKFDPLRPADAAGDVYKRQEFTQPVLWALSVPVWMGAACLMLTLPVSFSSDAEEAVAISIMLLEAVLLAPAAVLAALVLGVLAVIKAAKHLGTAQGTRAYTELPLAVSIIALFATVAMVGLGAWSILHLSLIHISRARAASRMALGSEKNTSGCSRYSSTSAGFS